MKTIKSFLVLSILLISTSVFAQAPGGGQRSGQQGPPPIPDTKQIEKMVSDLADEIVLNTDQEVKILELYKAHFVQVKELSTGNSRPDKSKMQALNATFEKQVKAKLTKTQVNKYESYLKTQNSKKRP